MTNKEQLNNYINRMNTWREFRGEALIDMDNIGSYVDDIMNNLKGNLSPENIHSDGEASTAEVNYLYKYYGQVYKGLQELGYEDADILYYL